MLIMLALIGVLIIFMFRNGKKRQQAMQELQNGLRPGAEVMLQSGIYGTIENVDEEQNRVTILSGTSTLIAHRSAVAQIVAPVEGETEELGGGLAPDDDPAFGERLTDEDPIAEPKIDDRPTQGDEPGDTQPPKA
ncbi:preprotein translocase subunit YajC [Leucobacter sp. CSA1]|uniref:Preprotein translocase subunit YajC n=2 Tax=Leucobacter chromiisoli TaxID=2796471 RepID=A0A934Q7N7_9MICO|nr:preprotein translocase subunit YajC [Leucobacter chromiisoli]